MKQVLSAKQRKKIHQQRLKQSDWYDLFIHWWDRCLRILSKSLVVCVILCFLFQLLLLQPQVRKWLCPVEELEGIPYSTKITIP